MGSGEIQKATTGALSRSDGRPPPPPPGRGGEPQRSDLWEYLDVARRYWWLILATTVVCVGAAWWTQRDAVPRYTAEVLLQQRQETPVTSEIEARLSGAGGGNFASQVEIIRSRAVLVPVVDSVGLQLRIRDDQERSLFTELVGDLEADRTTPGGLFSLRFAGGGLVLRDARADTVVGRFGAGETVEGPGFRLDVERPGALREPVEFSVANREVAVNLLQGSLQIEQGKGPDLIWVRYTSEDPELSAEVVNTVGSAYRNYRMNTGRQSAQRRRDVIADQLVELADSLREEQAKLEQYQRSTDVLNPEAKGSALVQQRFQIENELRELRYDESLLEGMVAGLEKGNDSNDSFQRLLAMGQELIPGVGSLQGRLQQLRTERQRLTASQFGHTEQSPEVQVVDSLIASTREDIRISAQEALQRVRSRIGQAESHLSEIRGEMNTVPARSARYSRLQQRVQAVQDVFDQLVGKYYEAQIAEGVEAGDVAVVNPAPVPLGPDPTHHGLNLVIALIAGLMLGSVGAATLDHLDSSVRTPRDAEEAAHLEVLGVIPSVSGSRKKTRAMLVGKEAFRGIRTNLRFSGETEPRSLAVTSSAPGEGKSTVAANLAVTYAEQGARVALVDADLRRPQLHRILPSGRVPGLTEYLTGKAELADVIRRVETVDRLDLVPAGKGAENPPALLDSERFEELIASLRSNYTIVILDTPPLLAVTDAGLVGARVDGAMLVIRANETNSDVVERATGQLRRLGASLLGVILNDVPVGGMYARSGYSYYDDYMDESELEDEDAGGTQLLTRPPEEKSA